MNSPIGPGRDSFWWGGLASSAAVFAWRPLRLYNVSKVLTAYWTVSSAFGVRRSGGSVDARVAARDTMHDADSFPARLIVCCQLLDGVGDTGGRRVPSFGGKSGFFSDIDFSGTLFALSYVVPGVGPVELWYEGRPFPRVGGESQSDGVGRGRGAVPGMVPVEADARNRTRESIRDRRRGKRRGGTSHRERWPAGGMDRSAVSVAVYAWYRSALRGKGKGLFVSLVLVPVLIGILCLGAGHEFLTDP